MWNVDSFSCTWVKLALALTLLSEASFASMVSMIPPKAPRQQMAASSQANYIASAGHTLAAAQVAQPAVTVKSYREWKQSKISEAEARLKNLKENVLRSRGLSLNATEAGLSTSLQRMLDNEELQFAMAQDLTITDYFIGYLARQKSLQQAIKEVSGKLSADEVAELMTAYADNFFSSKPTSAVQPPRADSGL